jgi:phosphohistidine phosphatase SixA
MALHLVRHAEAGRSPDEVRPLDDTGRRQAERIADLLADAGVGRVLSSRYTRCRQTIEPLAARIGVAVEEHDDLCEEADVDAAWALLESLADEHVVLCSHGNIISPLLDRVLRRGAEVVADEWSCRKGSVWRLDAEGERPFVRATLLT